MCNVITKATDQQNEQHYDMIRYVHLKTPDYSLPHDIKTINEQRRHQLLILLCLDTYAHAKSDNFQKAVVVI